MRSTFRIASLAAAILLTTATGAFAFPIGPSLTLGAPHPLDLSIEAKPFSQFSFAVSGGTLSVPIQNSITVGITNFDLRARWHPFSGAFFLGLAGGTQTIAGQATENIIAPNGDSVPTTLSLNIQSLYVTPHFGWFWLDKSGFNLGFELGWQFPFSPSSTFSVTVNNPKYASDQSAVEQTAEYQKLQSDIENAGNKLGSTSFPYVTVLRIGWLF